MNIDRAANIAILAIVVLTVGLTGVTIAQPSPSPDRAIIVGAQGVAHGHLAVVQPNGSYSTHYERAESYHSVATLNDSHWLTSYANRSGQTGFRVVGPDGIERQWSIQAATMRHSEVHDTEQLPNGNMLVADMDRERVRVVAPNGSTVWDWNGTELYEPPANILTEDWLHINDVDRIGPGRYLVSVRNSNQLLILERGHGVTEIVNRDDTDSNDANCRGRRDNQLASPDPRCGDPTVLDHQHNPQWLAEGRILVADSENRRVVELQRQPNGTWTVVWAVDGAGGQDFLWPRDADRLPSGNTLITDSRNHRVVLVDKEGEMLAEWSTPKLPYEADLLRGPGEQVGGPVHDGDYTTGRFNEPGLLHGVVVALNHSVGLPAWIAWWHFGALLLIGTIEFAAQIGSVARDRRRSTDEHSEVTTADD